MIMNKIQFLYQKIKVKRDLSILDRIEPKLEDIDRPVNLNDVLCLMNKKGVAFIVSGYGTAYFASIESNPYKKNCKITQLTASSPVYNLLKPLEHQLPKTLQQIRAYIEMDDYKYLTTKGENE